MRKDSLLDCLQLKCPIYEGRPYTETIEEECLSYRSGIQGSRGAGKDEFWVEELRERDQGRGVRLGVTLRASSECGAEL